MRWAGAAAHGLSTSPPLSRWPAREFQCTQAGGISSQTMTQVVHLNTMHSVLACAVHMQSKAVCGDTASGPAGTRPARSMDWSRACA